MKRNRALAGAEGARHRLNADEPWPGLAAFEEVDHEFFHGRDEESAELLRLVRRESLSVLFGRSGLGKTSLLKAGLFPLLRDEDVLPVYVRLDHGLNAQPLRDQLFGMLAAEAAGRAVQASAPLPDEPLWSFFHRRDVEFWSALNRPVTPLVVLDQFEEVFTLGQQDAASRSRTAAFLEELACLVENRPPQAVRTAVELDPGAARSYDFRRATVKLVLSFREDFLAEMESLKVQMPSIMHNRLRLLPMDGRQAYTVVAGSGGVLVDDHIARCILRLAWRNEPAPPVQQAEFEAIEIDPPLLSVVCSELNHKRRAIVPPLPRITEALLAGADREILSGFYERSLGGLDERVRDFIEKELITERGFRDSHDWEDALALPGVTQHELETLIARRLLRSEERQGRRRVELTHDVLTRVVMSSRDRRQIESQAEGQRLREAARRRRQRRLLAFGGLAAVVAVALIVTFALLLRESDLKRRELAQTQSRVLLDRANALFEQAVPGEPQSALAQALELHPGNEAAAARALAYLAQRGFPEMLGDETPVLAAGARVGDVQWAKPDRVSVHQGEAAPVLHVPVPAAAGSEPHAAAATPRLPRELPSTAAAASWAYDPRRPFEEGGALRVWLEPAVEGGVLRASPLTGRGTASALPVALAQAPVVLSVDGTRAMLRAGGDRQAQVLVFALAVDRTPTLLHVIDAAQGSLRFGAEGRRLVALAARHATLYDLDTGRLQTLPHALPVNLLAIGPDDRLVATASQDQIARMWDSTSGEQVGRPLRHGGAVVALDFRADGRSLATGAQDGTARLWSVPEGRPLAEPLLAGAPVQWVRFSQGGERVLVFDAAARLSWWRVSDPAPSRTVVRLPAAVASGALTFDATRGLLAAGSADGSLGLWRAVTQPSGIPLLEPLWQHRLPVVASVIALSPDASRLAVADAQHRVQVLDTATGLSVGTPLPHDAAVLSLRFSADSTRLVSTAADGAARVFDTTGPRRLGFPLAARRGAAVRAELSPDGRYLLASVWVDAGRAQVWLWSMDERQAVQVGEGDHVALAAFTAPGTFVTVVGGTVQRWHVQPGVVPGVVAAGAALTLGHVVWSAAVSADSRRLALGGINGVTRTVDLAGWRTTGEPMKTTGQVESLAFSADGRWLLVRDAEGLARVWHADTGVAVADAMSAPVAGWLGGNGAQVVTVDGDGAVALQRLGLDAPLPAPAWLPSLITAAGGATLDENGSIAWARDRAERLARISSLPSDLNEEWMKRRHQLLQRAGFVSGNQQSR